MYKGFVGYRSVLKFRARRLPF